MRCTFGGLLAWVLLFASGCTNTQLRITTINQGSTLSDLQYQMVLRNLASIAADPWAIPWHLSITAGTAQVADAATGHITPLWQWAIAGKDGFNQFGTGVSGSRTIVQQWSTNPIAHTDALRLLQIAYRRAYGSQEMPDAKLLDDLAHDIKKQVITTEDLRTESALFYQTHYNEEKRSYDSLRRRTTSTVGEQTVVSAGEEPEPLADRKSPLAREVAREVNDIIEDLQAIHAGWFGVGRKHDVPKDACYVAHEGKVYVWVSPEHRAELSKFTLAILDIATAVQEPQTLTLEGGGPTFSPGYFPPP